MHYIQKIYARWKSIESDRKLAWFAGLGLILFCLHNETLTYHTGDKVAIWLPQWGEILLGAVIIKLWIDKRLSLGRKIIWIPLLVIVSFICIRTTVSAYNGHDEAVAEILFALILFGCYVIGKELGSRIFEPCLLFVPIIAISTVWHSLDAIPSTHLQSYTNGGIVSPTNYTGGAELLSLCAIASVFCLNNLWLRLTIIVMATVGVIFTGAPEGVVALALVGIYALYKEWKTRHIMVLVSVLVVVCALWFGIGAGMTQHEKTFAVTENALKGEFDTPKNKKPGEIIGWGTGRYPAYVRAINDIEIIGHEYDIYSYQNDTGEVIVHQIPLVIMDQIGPIAAISWLFVTLYVFIKSKWKYLWVVFLAYCLFDHLLWTCYAPWWWVLIGVTSVWRLKSEGRLFCNENEILKQKQYQDKNKANTIGNSARAY